MSNACKGSLPRNEQYIQGGALSGMSNINKESSQDEHKQGGVFPGLNNTNREESLQD